MSMSHDEMLIRTRKYLCRTSESLVAHVNARSHTHYALSHRRKKKNAYVAQANIFVARGDILVAQTIKSQAQKAISY